MVAEGGQLHLTASSITIQKCILVPLQQALGNLPDQIYLVTLSSYLLGVQLECSQTVRLVQITLAIYQGSEVPSYTFQRANTSLVT